MRRRKLRKPTQWRQVNLRIKEELRCKLVAAAKDNEISFNEEVRKRLEASLQQQSFDDLKERVRCLEDRVESERVRRLQQDITMRSDVAAFVEEQLNGGNAER